MCFKGKYTFLSILLMLPGFLWAQPTDRQLKNLEAFTKLYGYVRFFHPSDEAANLNMYRFATYGSMRMLTIENDAQLITCLQEIFHPFAPTIQLFSTAKPEVFLPQHITPKNSAGYNTIYWQHNGFKLNSPDPSFSSQRSNRETKEVKKDKVGNLISIAYPITSTINLEKYKGKEFELKFEALIPGADNQNVTTVIQAVRDVYKKNNKLFYAVTPQSKLTAQKKAFKFKGLINEEVNNIVFKLSMDKKQRLDINNITLDILDHNKPIAIDITTQKKINEGARSAVYYLVVDQNQYNLSNVNDKADTYIKKEISAGITAIIPTVLYGNQFHTFPAADSLSLKKLNDQMFQTMIKDGNGNIVDSGDILPIRLSDIVTSWNILQHSSPYWPSNAANLDKGLKSGFENAFKNKTGTEFITTLKELYAPLNDGLLNIYLNDGGEIEDHYFAPLLLAEIEGKIVVRRVLDTALATKISTGDQLQAIDHTPIRDWLVLNDKYRSGSSTLKIEQQLSQLTKGKINEPISLTLGHEGKSYTIQTNRTNAGRFNGQSYVVSETVSNGWIKPDVYCLKWGTGNNKELLRAKSIIIDMRYPDFKESYAPLTHLVQHPVNVTYLLPVITPSELPVTNYQEVAQSIAKDSLQFSPTIFFLTNASTMGYAENVISILKKEKIGTIIGQQTAGAAGKMNKFFILGDLGFTYTGALMQSAAVPTGIVPDITVNPTIEDIKRGTDTVLEAAILKCTIKNQPYEQ